MMLGQIARVPPPFCPRHNVNLHLLCCGAKSLEKNQGKLFYGCPQSDFFHKETEEERIALDGGAECTRDEAPCPFVWYDTKMYVDLGLPRGWALKPQHRQNWSRVDSEDGAGACPSAVAAKPHPPGFQAVPFKPRAPSDGTGVAPIMSHYAHLSSTAAFPLLFAVDVPLLTTENAILQRRHRGTR